MKKVKTIRIGLLGFGAVGRAVLRYLTEETATKALLREGLAVTVTGVATGSRGNAIAESGIDIERLLALPKGESVASLHRGPEAETALQFTLRVPADILLVLTPASIPSVEEIRAAFARGMHVVTSNKTPVANHYHALATEARKRGVQLRFGATVLAGFPPWRHFFQSVTEPNITEMQIVVNATSNQILTMMHDEGKSFAEGVARAQELGIAERDPSDDVDGHDTQKKLAILANALMDADLTPADIPTTGIRKVTPAALKKADEAGKWIHLLGRAWWDSSGTVRAEVKPVETDNPFFTQMRGTSMGLYFTTSAARFGIRLDLDKGERAIMATAAGVFEDILTVAKAL